MALSILRCVMHKVFWCHEHEIHFISTDVSFCPLCNTIMAEIGWIERRVDDSDDGEEAT